MTQDPKDLIKWTNLSRRLSGSDNSIRANKIPKKYKTKVKVLFMLLSFWDKWVDEI